MKIKYFKSSIFIILILTCILLLYLRIFKNQLTNWDDDVYILRNPFIRSLNLNNLKTIFTEFYCGNYHPITMLSYAINYTISGIKPWSYQLFNIIFHLLNVYLVFVFIRYLLEIKTGRISERGNIISIVVALLFGINTMQVESVAWVSERKNVLYSFFYLISMIFYLKYLKGYIKKFFILSLLMFLFSVLSKGMAVTLTLSLIVVDYYFERGLLNRRVIIEKVPYFIISLIFGIIAIKAQRESGATVKEFYLGLVDRIAIASYGFTQYIIRLIYPHKLSAYYPYPVKAGERLPVEYYCSIIVPLILGIIMIRLLNRNKVIVSGLMFFIVNVITVLQLLPVGDAVMADRYVYVSSVGLFFIIGYYGVDLYYRYKDRYGNLIISLFVLYVYIIGLKTYQRIGVWQDSLSLWNDSIKKYPVNNDRGYLNRGNIYFELGKFDDALIDYNRAILIDSFNSASYVGLSLINLELRNYDAAMKYINKAIELKKTYDAYVNRSIIKIEKNLFEEALKDLDTAYSINKTRPEVFINRGIIKIKNGKYYESLIEFDKAEKIDRYHFAIYLYRSVALIEMKNFDYALKNLNTSLRLKETGMAYYLKGKIYYNSKNIVLACNSFKKAISLGYKEIEEEFYNLCNL